MIELTFWLFGLASLGILFTKASSIVEAGVCLATLRRMVVVLVTAIAKSAEALAESTKEKV